jgi:two-component system, sensor histidine kinase PdtaS
LTLHTPAHPDVGLNLALAVIAASNAPVLLLDGELDIVAASNSFCDAFGFGDPKKISGKSLSGLGEGEWSSPQLASLLAITALRHAEVHSYEMDLVRFGMPTLCLVLNARKLDLGEDTAVRLVLAITDVTRARANARHKDDLVREKAILLEELQHRVANSLQIVASVLMQSVRNVQSEETRGYLRDAHNRIMSVGLLQKQLSSASLGEVAITPYLDELCRTIGASMIHDGGKVSIVVRGDVGVTSADASVSLGLIVTELVINALKHAFPDGRKGKIDVDYQSNGLAWTLKVNDDGVGIPTGEAAPAPGLGTGIVDALSKQLHAIHGIETDGSGTRITIAHAA